MSDKGRPAEVIYCDVSDTNLRNYMASEWYFVPLFIFAVVVMIIVFSGIGFILALLLAVIVKYIAIELQVELANPIPLYIGSALAIPILGACWYYVGTRKQRSPMVPAYGKTIVEIGKELTAFRKRLPGDRRDFRWGRLSIAGALAILSILVTAVALMELDMIDRLQSTDKLSEILYYVMSFLMFALLINGIRMYKGGGFFDATAEELRRNDARQPVLLLRAFQDDIKHVVLQHVPKDADASMKE